MKVLVTGGAGFVGSHLVDRLIDEGHEVVVVDHYRRKKRRFPNPKAVLYKKSFSDKEAMQDIFTKEQPDVLMHLAAQISVTKSIADPVADARTNIVDAISLLDIARASGVKRVIFSSSGGAIYGDHHVRPTPEIMNAKPISPYGIGKQAMEHYLNWYGQQHDMSIVSLRFANIYGPRQLSTGEGGVVSIFIDRILSGKPVTIFGDGSSTRDYVYVDDAVDAFMQAMRTQHQGAVNISTGTEVSVQDLWRLVQDVHGEEGEVEYAAFRPGEVMKSVLSAESAKSVLPWKPKTSLKEGIQRTYNWFKKIRTEGER